MADAWWKKAIIYQVYPRSFKDSNGDGIGDIPGIVEKLDYIRDLGVTAIWLNPIFESPHVDNGYDVSNYRKIDPVFGTMEDVENLIREAKKRGLKIILDLVLNHTSDCHPWFEAARKSKDNPYRDYYIWHDPVDGHEPTNWASFFGGSTWSYDEQTRQYYFHLFSDTMPDLNWENKKVREEMAKIALYWLDKGIDGFRLDAVIHMAKDTRFLSVNTENADEKFVPAEQYFANLPRVHEYIREFNRTIKKAYPDAFLIGETASADTKLARLYSDPSREECDAIITFHYLGFDTEAKNPNIPQNWQQGKWDLLAFKKVMAKWQKDLYRKGLNSLYWNNHDMPRLLSRFGDKGRYREKSAKMLATLMYLQWGVPILLQGEEIGLVNLKLPRLEDYEDPSIRGLIPVANKAGYTEAEILQMVQKRSKDTSRGAMQWNSEPHGGFSTYAPWLGINEDYRTVNVASQEKDTDSVLYYYRKLLKLKKSMTVFTAGSWETLAGNDPNIYAYLRTYKGRRAMVVCNTSKKRQTFTCPELARFKWECLLNNNGYQAEIPSKLVLLPYECFVLLQKQQPKRGGTNMELAGIFHQPFTDAYVYDKETMHLKLRTKKGDIANVLLVWGDPYLFKKNKDGEYRWQSERLGMKKVVETEAHDYWFAEVKPPHRRVQYAFLLTGTDGKDIFYGGRGFYPPNEDTLNVPDYYFKFPFMHETDMFKAPDWVKSTVWYQIFPERFANGNPDISPKNVLPWGSKEPGVNDFFGGDLQGIIDHLDYLSNLGINGIYLTPIFEAPSNHKYDTFDYFTIDPHFGDKETFRKLVEKAHKRGIRIMLDAVFNHIGKNSNQWQDVLENGENSRYKDWFHIHSFPVREGDNGNIDGHDTLSFDTFAFTTSMPKLNTANPEVQKYLLDIATYWIREFDIDGWRLDVANEVDHTFWKKFRQAVVKEKPDIFILGEIWHDSWPWLLGDEFHSVMNYPFTQTIIEYFVDEKISAEKMMHSINQHFMHYMQSNNEVLFNMLDSHDTPRILTKCGGDKQKVKLALAFTFAHAGSPCIYYGTEVGIDGGGDPLCRKCMVWEEDKQDRDMLAFTKKLIRFRKDYQPTLTYGDLIWLKTDNDKQVVCFLRKDKNRTLLFAFNRSDAEQSIPWDDLKVKNSDSAKNIWENKPVQASALVLPPMQFTILEISD